MPKRLAVVTVVLALSLASSVAVSQQSEEARALVGTWTWTLENKCTESYTFSADGIVEVKSGDEITKNSYMLSGKSGEFDRYRVDLKVLEDSGGRDCDNDTKVNVGETDTVFVQFSKDKEMMLMCQNPTSTFCFGPLRRAKP